MRTKKSKRLAQFETYKQKVAFSSSLYEKLRDKYRSPAGFDDWNKMLLKLAPYGEPDFLKAVKSATPKWKENNRAPLMASMGAFIASRLDAPAVYVSRELTSALIRTEPSVTEQPELVLPCFFVCLPRGAFYTLEGSAITSVLVYTPEAFEQSLIDLKLMPEEIDSYLEHSKSRKDCMFIVAETDAHDLYSSTTAWDSEGPAYDGTLRWSTCTALENIAKNVVLIYNYQRTLISSCKPTSRGAGFSSKTTELTRAPLPTTLLGRDFFTRTTTTYKQNPSNNTGTFRRPHWRKGHWHTVLTGAGRKERKLRWFQPVYVNPTLDT